MRGLSSLRLELQVAHRFRELGIFLGVVVVVVAAVVVAAVVVVVVVVIVIMVVAVEISHTPWAPS